MTIDRTDPSASGGNFGNRSPQANCNCVVVAVSSQPRVGLSVMPATALIDNCRPRVRAPFTSTSTSAGLQVCWLIF